MNTKKLDQTLFFSMTLDFLEIYLIKEKDGSAHTRKSYREALSIFRRYVSSEKQCSIKTFRFLDCTYDFVLDYRNWLYDVKNCSASTANHRLAVLKSYIQYAAARDLAVQQVALCVDEVPFLRVPKKLRPILSKDHLSELFMLPKNTHLGRRDLMILVLLFDTAVRVEELVKLKIENVILFVMEPYILVEGKGDRERTVALNSKTIALLKDYIEEFHTGNAHGPLFYTVIKGEKGRMSTRNVERIVKKYADLLRNRIPGIPESVYPHMFRRTRASGLYQDGVDISLISKVLGHSSIETTKDHYAIPSLEQKKAAMEKGSACEPGVQQEQMWPDDEDELARICGLT
ncbi:MAG: site-specific integrase [Schaedlerella sp.]